MKNIPILILMFFQSMLFSQITMHIQISDHIGLQKKIEIELINESDEFYALPIDTTGVRGASSLIESCNGKIVSNWKPTVHLHMINSDRYLEYDYNFAHGSSDIFRKLEEETSGDSSIKDIFIRIAPRQKIIYTLLFDPMNFNDKIIYHELFYITPNIIYDLSLSFHQTNEAKRVIEKQITLNGNVYKIFVGKIESNKVMTSWAPKMFEPKN